MTRHYDMGPLPTSLPPSVAEKLEEENKNLRMLLLGMLSWMEQLASEMKEDAEECEDARSLYDLLKGYSNDITNKVNNFTEQLK